MEERSDTNLDLQKLVQLPPIKASSFLHKTINCKQMLTMKKASAPPKSIKKQVRAKCSPLSKYLFSLNSLHGSRRRERRPVTIAITGATQLINVNGFFRPR